MKQPKDRRTGAYFAHLGMLGAQTRHHRYWRDIRAFAIPVLIAALGQTLIYSAIFLRTGRADFFSLVPTIAALTGVPVLSAFILTAFRRNEAPIVSALAVVLVFFSFAVTVLSAFRIPMSYGALAAALPVSTVAMAFANIGFHRAIRDRVGVIGFAGAPTVVALFNGTVAMIGSPEEDVTRFDTILVDPNQHPSGEWAHLLSRCYLSGVEILPWTRFLEIHMGRVDVSSFDLSHLQYSPSQRLYARAKRLLDLLIVVLTLPITIPLALFTAAYISLRDGGQVLFVQHRYGLGGRVFRLYKFRTMYRGTRGGATVVADKRIIPGCRFIRRARLDELPQLYNILKGDMTLIGPRPEAADLVRWYRKEIPEWDYRTLVLPGITGWAQVNNGATSTPAEARTKLAYDLYYIKHLSFDLDLQILFRTVRTVLFGTGAR
ncbi:sugar transferase [Pelagibacterium limicola]|uniref:sugar transferase n=1 Tax=Pelagibacterium limicola TaxID=2791022 RepID=UPI0018AF7773|nr:sugar transferase [Pelagibacterium limicola]